MSAASFLSPFSQPQPLTRVPFGDGFLTGDDLLAAGERGDVVRLAAIVDAGLDVDVRNKSLETALHVASRGGQTAACSVLLSKGANVDASDVHGRRPMHWAAQRGDVQIADLLIQNGADVNPRGATGHTPLHWAASGGHRDVCRLLVEKGAEPRTRVASSGQSALHCACEKAQASACRVLLDLVGDGDPAARPALLTSRDKKGRTPLHVAAEVGAEACVKVLLRHGANAAALLVAPSEIVEHDGVVSGRPDPLKMESSSVALGMDAASGETPLHAACRRGHAACVAALIGSRDGANASQIRDMEGRTPLQLARRLSGPSKHAICELLVSQAASIAQLPSSPSRSSLAVPSSPPAGSAKARGWKDGAPGGFGLDAAWLSARPSSASSPPKMLGVTRTERRKTSGLNEDEVEAELHAAALAAMENYFLAMAHELGEKADRARAKARREQSSTKLAAFLSKVEPQKMATPPRETREDRNEPSPIGFGADAIAAVLNSPSPTKQSRFGAPSAHSPPRAAPAVVPAAALVPQEEANAQLEAKAEATVEQPAQQEPAESKPPSRPTSAHSPPRAAPAVVPAAALVPQEEANAQLEAKAEATVEQPAQQEPAESKPPSRPTSARGVKTSFAKKALFG